MPPRPATYYQTLTAAERAALITYYTRIVATSKSPDRVGRALRQLQQLRAAEAR